MAPEVESVSPMTDPRSTGLARLFASAIAFCNHHRTLGGPALVLASCLGIHSVLWLLGPTLFFDHGWVVTWPVNAFTVAAMLMMPRWCWPWLQLGSLLDQAYANAREPHLLIAVDALSNTLEVAIIAYALPPFRTLTEWMQEPRLFARFVTYALLVAPGITSIPMGLYFLHGYHRGFWEYSIRWVLADALGMSLWLPLVLALRSRETYAIFRLRSLVSTLSLLALVVSVSWMIFHQNLYPIAFMVMPALLLVVFRLGFSGSTLATILLTIIVSHATLHGHGPFQLIPHPWDRYRVAVLQVYLTLCILLSLPVSVVLLQRRIFEAQLGDAYLRMEAAATLDGLTGIANRRRLDLALDTEWHRAMRDNSALALMMVDVDFFKLYNDSYGHVAGDDCLRRIAEAISSVVHRSSDLVARYGGEEFAVLLPGAGEAATRRLAERILYEVASLELDHCRSDHAVVTVSIGCRVIQPQMGSCATSLLQGADRALYTAKQSGRNCVVFDTASQAQPQDEIPALL